MIQPISHLYDEITNFFVAGKLLVRLEMAIKNNQLSRAVFINPELEKIRTPFANLDNREINLQGTFLSYLWSVCYCTIAFQRMTVEQVEEDIIKLRNSPEADIINQLFDWAISLKVAYSDWPVDLPRPGQNDEYVLETNTLFLFTIRYIMYHEVGHLALHNGSMELLHQKRRDASLSSEDSRRLRAMELQADDYAINILISTNADERYRYMNLLGAAVALLASFYLLRDDDVRGGQTHPDLDVRLKRLSKQANFQEQQHTLFFNATVSTGIQVFFHRFDVNYLPDNQGDWRMTDFTELFAVLYEKIDARKALYTQYWPFIK